MPPFVRNSLARATDFWKNISLPQRVLLGGLLASLLIVLSALLFWMKFTTPFPTNAGPGCCTA